MALSKSLGQSISAQISFQYRGPGGEYWYGFGLAPYPRTNVLQWYVRSTTLPNANIWQTITATIDDIIPYWFEAPYYYDSDVVVYKPDGTVVLEKWDDTVYYVEAPY